MSSIDYYDVQAMIRDAHSEIRSELRSELNDLERQISALRNVLDARVADLEERLNVRV